MKIEDARDKARRIIRAIRAAVAGEITEDTTFEGIALGWFKARVVDRKLRSETKTGALLKKRIIPAFAGMEFVDVRRKHITTLLDQIQARSGVRQADIALSIISGICEWHGKRDEEYDSPIIRGMKREEKNDRDRVLTDSEIRTLWQTDGLLGNFTKLALLTGQRREKLLTMRYDDVRNGVWYIRSEEREGQWRRVAPPHHRARDTGTAEADMSGASRVRLPNHQTQKLETEVRPQAPHAALGAARSSPDKPDPDGRGRCDERRGRVGAWSRSTWRRGHL